MCNSSLELPHLTMGCCRAPLLLALGLARTAAAQDIEDHGCDKVYLGHDIGWQDIYEYHDEDGDCKLSFKELQNVCREHYAQCSSFLTSTHKTKDGQQCGKVEMEQRLNAGGDVCCKYNNGKLCGTFAIGTGPAATERINGYGNIAYECADEGREAVVIGSTSEGTKTIVMPMPSRACKNSIVGLRFPKIDIPKNAVIDAAYVLFAVTPQGEQVHHCARCSSRSAVLLRAVPWLVMSVP